MKYKVTVSSQGRGLDDQGWINANATVYQNCSNETWGSCGGHNRDDQGKSSIGKL